jgi:branched-chain amino acid transport system permease protein
MIIHILNGLSFGFLLFLLGSGFSLVVGLIRIINLAHGSSFMLGAYIGLTVLKWTGSFWLAAASGGFIVGVFGGLLERLLLHRLYLKPLNQVLLTFGFIYIIMDICKWLWGGDPLILSKPLLLRGSIEIFGNFYPVYRLAVIVIGCLVAILLWFLLEKSLIGAIVRAGVDDRQMVNGLGININLISSGVFALGAFMAGFGGVIGGPILGVYLGLDLEVQILSLVVVVVGGLGSLKGALVGSLLIGMLDNLGKAFFPDFAMVIIFLAMACVILFKPSGLLGKED